jgi:phosphopantetheine adenylyltransferase/predicted metal-dependent HD superfamily phosphohydrolase
MDSEQNNIHSDKEGSTLLQSCIDKLNNTRMLYFINSHIIIKDFPIDIFESFDSNKYYQKLLSFYVYLVNKVIQKTESLITLSIYFNKSENNCFDFHNLEFKKLERIFYLFYSFAIDIKFIENKKFFINFPELKINRQDKDGVKLENQNFEQNQSEFFLIDTKNNEDSNTIFYDSNLCSEKNVIDSKLNNSKYFMFNKSDYEIYLQRSDKISEYQILQKFQSMEKCISNTSEELKLFSYDSVILGGSFDHYHMGHNMLISTAILLSRKSLKLGLTSQEMISKKCSTFYLQTYSIREANLRNVFNYLGGDCDFEIFPLNDPVGSAATDNEIQALILTEETIKGGHLVNSCRIQNNLPELSLITANLICSSEQLDVSNKILSKISSSSIRKNILNQIKEEKIEYLNELWKKLTQDILKCSSQVSLNWFSLIRDYYMQSWRSYHTLNHIYYYLSGAEKLHMKGKIKSYVNVMLAIWFHDIINTPSRADNEERSVQIFLNFYEDIKIYLAREKTFSLIQPDKISYFIMQTKSHFEDINYDEEDLNYFLDLDLASFGQQDLEKYLKGSENIKFEFSHHLEESEWNFGRSEFLKSVLKKKFIFRTEEFRKMNEELARRNIQAEIEIYLYKNKN